MRSLMSISLFLFAAQAGAQCNNAPAPKTPPAQEQELFSPRIQDIEFLKGQPEPYNPWRPENPNAFWFMTDRFSEADLRDLAEFSRQALTPQDINIAGLENRPVDISLRPQPAPVNSGKPLAAPVPPPAPTPSRPQKKSFLKRLFRTGKEKPGTTAPAQATQQPAK